MEIVLYTTNCPQCQVLEAAMKSKDIAYRVVTDVPEIMTVAAATGIHSVPIMRLDDAIMPYADALRWVNSYQKAGDSDVN